MASTNPVQMLKDDHEKVRTLFRQFESADGDKRQQIADQLFMELEVHTSIEEEIFYPAMRSAGDAQDKEEVAHAYEEHAGAKQLMQQLRGMPASDQQFMTMWQQLRKDVEHHAHEEETEMLPKAEQELGGQMDRLGQEMMARKEQLMGQMQGQMRR